MYFYIWNSIIYAFKIFEVVPSFSYINGINSGNYLSSLCWRHALQKFRELDRR